MRQMMIQVERGRGEWVMDRARELEAVNPVLLEGRWDGGPCDVVVAHFSNSRVGTAVSRLEELEGVRVSFFPQGVLALKPATQRAPEQVRDVETLSPLEVLLSGLQSIGSWRGFLGYAVAAGAVVWIGLYTNTVYLLVAAMLIAPFAGPAMNSALATASGDGRLLRRSLLRYVAGLAVSGTVAWALSMTMRQQIATSQMVEQSQLSAVAVLLPLVAGAAGALNLMRSERDSLVSGAATGMLVAASLAPPVGLVGMAAAIGRWDMAGDGLFVLVLQLVGIHLAGAAVFRTAGMRAEGRRYGAGWRWLFPVGTAVSLAAVVGLVALQWGLPVELTRSSLAQRVTAHLQDAVEADGSVRLVEAEARFTRSDRVPGGTVLAEVYVVEQAGAGAETRREMEEALGQRLQGAVAQRWPELEPLVQVRVLAW